jgi:tetratricopeptide (TPR) repeat protein
MKLRRAVGSKGIASLLVAVALAFSSCVSSPEAKSAQFIEKGKKLMNQKDAPRAILAFLNAVQATPKNAEAYYQLGLAHLATGDLRKGVASIRRALELNPKHEAAQLRLAELMTHTSDQDILHEAQVRLMTLLQSSPNNTDALHALALTELKLGEPQDAEQHLEQAISLAPQELILAVTLADAKVQEKDFKAAEDILKNACANNSKAADCSVILGRLYWIEKKPSDAEQQFRKALGMDANHAAALLNLGTLENALGRKQEAEEMFKRLSALPDHAFDSYHAIFLFQEGRREEAVKEFEALFQKNPDNREARTRLVAAYQAVDRLPDARKILNDALKKNPKDLDALLQRGETLIADRKYAEAEADLNRVVMLKADSPDIHYALSRLYRARGAEMRRRQELNEVLRLNPAQLQVRLELAAALIQEKSGAAALAILDNAPGEQKKLLILVELRNWALLSTNRLAEARKGVDLGLAAVRSPDLLAQDGYLKIAEKRYDAARESLKEGMSKNPEDVRLLRFLMASYSAQNRIPAGVQAVQAYAAEHPKSGAIQYFLGNLLLQTGAQDQARQAFAAAKALNYAPADLSLAQVDLVKANWKDAQQQLNTILSSGGEDPKAREWLGMVEASQGSSAAAIADFRKVLENQPDNAIALNNLAFLLAEEGQAREARKYAEKAVELAPNNPDFEDTLGWVLYREGLFDGAVTHLQSAFSKSGDARQQYHLAAAYFKKGDSAHGHATLTAAMRKNPNLPEAQLAQQAERESAPRH